MTSKRSALRPLTRGPRAKEPPTPLGDAPGFRTPETLLGLPKVRVAGGTYLLRGGQVLTMGPLGVFQGDVLVDGGRISALGSELQAPGAEVVDCSSQLVLPGFVQPHIHLCQTLFRGRADGLPLLEWLKGRIWPFEAAHDRRSLEVSARLGIGELLLSGTTTILDMGTVHHTDVLFEVAREMGIRAVIGKAMMDTGEGVPPALVDRTEVSLRESCELADRWHGVERLGYAFSPRFVLSCTEGLMRDTVQEARRRGLRIHTHASENPREVAAVRKVYGKGNLEVLAALELMGPDVVVAHGVCLAGPERRLLAETGTHLVHCPSTNLKLASGIAEVPELLEAGVSIGLASDGAACNNTLDAFSEMRLAGLLHAPRAGVSALTPEAVVRLATFGGAQVLGLEAEVGSLEVGKRADIAVVDTLSLHAAPVEDAFSMLVYTLGPPDVRHVLVDGVFRVRNRELQTADVETLIELARQEVRRLERFLSPL